MDSPQPKVDLEKGLVDIGIKEKIALTNKQLVKDRISDPLPKLNADRGPLDKPIICDSCSKVITSPYIT